MSSSESESDYDENVADNGQNEKGGTNSDGEEAGPRQTRQKPASDITQIYTQKLVQSDSPKTERASRDKPARDITQLYTAALTKEDKSPSRLGDLPKRTGDITKLYTGGLGSADSKPFKGKPNDERTAPTKVAW